MLEPLVQHQLHCVKPRYCKYSLCYNHEGCMKSVMLERLVQHQLHLVKPKDNVSTIYDIIMKTV